MILEIKKLFGIKYARPGYPDRDLDFPCAASLPSQQETTSHHETAEDKLIYKGVTRDWNWAVRRMIYERAVCKKEWLDPNSAYFGCYLFIDYYGGRSNIKSYHPQTAKSNDVDTDWINKHYQSYSDWQIAKYKRGYYDWGGRQLG